MKKTGKLVLFTFVSLIFLLSGCAPALAPIPPTPTSTTTIMAPTLMPSPTITPTFIPSPTITPSPFVATFDDNLCEIQGSIILEGEFWPLQGSISTLYDAKIEGFPSYLSMLRGKPTSGEFDEVDIFIWVKHSTSPGPNEMATLPDQYSIDDVKIYTSDNSAVTGVIPRPARLQLHTIASVILLTPGPKGLSPLKKCEYVLEEIQFQ